MAGKQRFRALRRLLPSASPFHDPDVSREDPKKVVGVLRGHNIISAYIKSSGQGPTPSPQVQPGA